MSFSYTTGIPAGPNNPSQDQPNMQTNTNSINDLIAVDHITFNANGGGQHKAITFNQDASYVPVPPVNPPQLFTMNASGLPQLFYYSGTSTQSVNQYTRTATSFSTILMGGLILKGGKFTATLATETITYSTIPDPLTPFINNTLAVFLQGVTSGGAGNTVISAVTSTDFTALLLTPGRQYYFLAIGY